MEAANFPIDDLALDFTPTAWMPTADPEAADNEPLTCSHCGRRLELMEATSKPSWKDVLGRQAESCPSWYAESLEADDRRFWDEAIGAGFYDWYLEHREESAYASAAARAPDSQPIQLSLPGLDPHCRAAPLHIQSF